MKLTHWLQPKRLLHWKFDPEVYCLLVDTLLDYLFVGFISVLFYDSGIFLFLESYKFIVFFRYTFRPRSRSSRNIWSYTSNLKWDFLYPSVCTICRRSYRGSQGEVTLGEGTLQLTWIDWVKIIYTIFTTRGERSNPLFSKLFCQMVSSIYSLFIRVLSSGHNNR